MEILVCVKRVPDTAENEIEVNSDGSDIERDDLTPGDVVSFLEERGVWLLATGLGRLRAVTHLDVDDAGIERACAAFEELAAR